MLIFVGLVIGLSGLRATDSAAANAKKNVFRFAFGEGEDAYDDGYADNAAEWKRLLTYYDEIFDDIANGEFYFLIESSIYNNVKATDLIQLNRATFRGNIIRSHLKIRLGVSSEQVAFCINRHISTPDIVQVSLIRQPMPPLMNKDIFYSLSNSKQDISRALLRYPEIPYYDLYYYVEETQPEQTISKEQATPVKETIPERQVAVTPVQAAKKTKETILPGARPFNLGIKTDLIPWLGVVPAWGVNGKSTSGYSKGALMYNGAVEYYFASRYSLEASFLYSYASYGGRADNLWGISRFTLEPRCWFVDDNTFRGFNAGLSLGYGDFDIRNNKPEKQGKTGRFYSAAFTLGYTLSVYRNLLVEGRLSLGYRNIYDGKEYRFEPSENKNYYENGFSVGQWVVGVSFNLMFRAGFR